MKTDPEKKSSGDKFGQCQEDNAFICSVKQLGAKIGGTRHSVSVPSVIPQYKKSGRGWKQLTKDLTRYVVPVRPGQNASHDGLTAKAFVLFCYRIVKTEQSKAENTNGCVIDTM